MRSRISKEDAADADKRMTDSYRPGNYLHLPDATQLSAFLNPTDSTSDVPWQLTGDVSIAAGVISPQSRSRVHVLPLVTQTTYVVSGSLELWMRAPDAAAPDRTLVDAGAAAVTPKGTLLQICNVTDAPAHVLYICSPSFVFEASEGSAPRYDDADIVADDWSEVDAVRPRINLEERQLLRSNALDRIRLAKQ